MKTFFEAAKESNAISLGTASYNVVGHKDADTEHGRLSKILLEKDGKSYLLELQFYGGCKAILWEHIEDVIEPSEEVECIGQEIQAC